MCVCMVCVRIVCVWCLMCVWYGVCIYGVCVVSVYVWCVCIVCGVWLYGRTDMGMSGLQERGGLAVPSQLVGRGSYLRREQSVQAERAGPLPTTTRMPGCLACATS